ncbi:hypothetical protein CRG98_012515 [Punica granatum]|uniref:Uncharacterized protein n=1 Tax=Punica granatum TaxID=22663 RepID=A0A2I0KF10_PUNGR|nr:hypothetical protein CRG98_012515 [Punica granatum]
MKVETATVKVEMAMVKAGTARGKQRRGEAEREREGRKLWWWSENGEGCGVMVMHMVMRRLIAPPKSQLPYHLFTVARESSLISPFPSSYPLHCPGKRERVIAGIGVGRPRGMEPGMNWHGRILPILHGMVGLLRGRNKGDYRDGVGKGGEVWAGAVLEVLGGGAVGVGGGEDIVAEGAPEPHGLGEAGVGGEREREGEIKEKMNKTTEVAMWEWSMVSSGVPHSYPHRHLYGHVMFYVKNERKHHGRIHGKPN